jgi:dTMP kinase
MLITIEGIDGSGKTTQSELLDERMDNIFLTSEPNEDTWYGQRVREVISNEGIESCPMSTFFMFMADRANNVSMLRNKMNDGNLVVSDRYIDSTLVYQSVELDNHIDGNTMEWIEDITYQPWCPIPDITFIIDIPAETAIGRINGDEEFERIKKLKKYRKKYLELAEKSDRYTIVDGSRSIDDVNKIMRDEICQLAHKDSKNVSITSTG